MSPDLFGRLVDIVTPGFLHWNKASGDAVDPYDDKRDFDDVQKKDDQAHRYAWLLQTDQGHTVATKDDNGIATSTLSDTAALDVVTLEPRKA